MRPEDVREIVHSLVYLLSHMSRYRLQIVKDILTIVALMLVILILGRIYLLS